jgi:hypothetical protein
MAVVFAKDFSVDHKKNEKRSIVARTGQHTTPGYEESHDESPIILGATVYTIQFFRSGPVLLLLTRPGVMPVGVIAVVPSYITGSHCHTS